MSTPTALPRALHQVLRELGVAEAVESDAAWRSRVVASGAAVAQGEVSERIRLIGGDAGALARALQGDAPRADTPGDRPDVTVFSGAVTASGRVELLPFLREQSISITNHRFGAPTRLTADVI